MSIKKFVGAAFCRPLAVLAALALSAMLVVGCSDDGDDGNPGNSGTTGNDNHFNPNITYGSFTDSRDGKIYRTVTIGTQTWMAENLNYAGTGVCYDNDESSCDIYGRLYRWVEAMNIDQQYENTRWNGGDVGHRGICPVGWHLPSDAEWTTLVSFVGSNAGTKLKSSTGWDRSNFRVPVGTDDFGFSALPGGYGGWWEWGGSFDRIGINGFWWSATEFGTDWARYRNMSYGSEDASSQHDRKDQVVSVRCVMN